MGAGGKIACKISLCEHLSRTFHNAGIVRLNVHYLSIAQQDDVSKAPGRPGKGRRGESSVCAGVQQRDRRWSRWPRTCSNACTRVCTSAGLMASAFLGRKVVVWFNHGKSKLIRPQCLRFIAQRLLHLRQMLSHIRRKAALARRHSNNFVLPPACLREKESSPTCPKWIRESLSIRGCCAWSGHPRPEPDVLPLATNTLCSPVRPFRRWRGPPLSRREHRQHCRLWPHCRCSPKEHGFA